MYGFVLSLLFFGCVPCIAQNVPSQVHIAFAGKNNKTQKKSKISNIVIDILRPF